MEYPDYLFDLQLFAGDDDLPDDNDLDGDVDDELDAEGLVNKDDDAEDTNPDDPENKGKVKTDKQDKALTSEKVEEIVKNRLERHEAKLDREFTREAGVEVSRAEIMQAAGLWGFLKLNPELSEQVQGVIDEYIAKGSYVKQNKHDDAKSVELARKEAILDRKAEDPYFSKNAKKILEWAEDEGFEIVDAKSLKRAVLAYKGANGRLERADEEHRNKQSTSKREAARNQSKVATSTSSGSPKARRDYSKMSDVDILAAEGKSLFTDD